MVAFFHREGKMSRSYSEGDFYNFTLGTESLSRCLGDSFILHRLIFCVIRLFRGYLTTTAKYANDAKRAGFSHRPSVVKLIALE